MLGYAPLLGQVRLVTHYHTVTKVRPHLGVIMPRFELTLTNGQRTKTEIMGFDTGLEVSHIQIPTSLAEFLGVVATGTKRMSDATQTIIVKTGTIEKITVSGKAGCSIESAKVIFYKEAPSLVGNNFIQDVGAEFAYENGIPKVKCSGPSQSRPVMLPIFVISMIHQGKVHNTPALFDTGWEGTDVAVPWSIAKEMGLPILNTTQGITHTGTVTLVQSKLDRLTLQQIPHCYVDGADVDILPESSPIQKVIVGEGFFKKINGRIGYDTQGAFFSCGAASGRAVRPADEAAGMIARPSGEGMIPDEVRITMGSDINPWLLTIGGLAGAGAIAYFVWPKPSKRRKVKSG